jgi:superfamily II DNA or RNA helicase
MGRYVLAMSYLDQALVDPRRPLDAEQRQQATELRTRAEALTGVLDLTVDPADCIVLMRPTKSASLYVQMAGRGLRLFPGKGNNNQPYLTAGKERSRKLTHILPVHSPSTASNPSL